MKSSKMPKSLVYCLLALYMPLTVIVALVFLLEKWLPISSIFLLIMAGAGALVAFIFCDYIKPNKSGYSAGNFRSGLAAMLIAYIFSSLFFRRLGGESGFLWKEQFLPTLPAILASLETFYVWVSVVSLKQLFSARERFEAYTTQHHGEQLKKALEQDFRLLQYSDKGIAGTKNFYLFQLIVVGVIAFFVIFSGITLALPVYLLLIIMLTSGICIIGFFGIIRREQYHAGEGMVLAVFDRLKHILAMGVLCAFAIAAAAFLSAGKSLLPFSLVSGLFSRLFGRSADSPLAEGAEAVPAKSQPLFSFLGGTETGAALPVQKLLQYGFVLLVIAGFIFVLIFLRLGRFRLSRKELPVDQSVGRTIIEWLKGLLFALGSFFWFFGKDKTPLESGKPSAGQLRRTSEAILGAYSQAKKQEMRQSVTLFARLIIWGSEVRHVQWKPAHGPGEYCGLLAVSVLPETAARQTEASQGKEILRCGELFEQALYSTEVLSATEQDEFRELVEEITSTSSFPDHSSLN